MSLVDTNTHLQFAVLCSVVKRGPSPVVSDDLSAVQQQPAEHLCVAPTGGKVHGCGPVTIPVCQADLCEAHLKRREKTTRVKES